jgi:hypothetical protein
MSSGAIEESDDGYFSNRAPVSKAVRQALAVLDSNTQGSVSALWLGRAAGSERLAARPCSWVPPPPCRRGVGVPTRPRCTGIANAQQVTRARFEIFQIFVTRHGRAVLRNAERVPEAQRRDREMFHPSLVCSTGIGSPSRKASLRRRMTRTHLGKADDVPARREPWPTSSIASAMQARETQHAPPPTA